MTLVFDNRAAVRNGPGVHALIAGVSAYPHLPGGSGPLARNTFGLQQLGSATLTGYKVSQWLQAHKDDFPVPLATIRLLLSPSAGEIAVEPALAGLADPCTFETLEREANAWREDAKTHRDSVTLFYWAGHGIESPLGDSVLLLENFGDGIAGILARHASTGNILSGMAPCDTFPDIARTQLYIIDACRAAPDSLRDLVSPMTAQLWDAALNVVDDRCAPIFYAALPGALAYARIGVQTLFSEALLKCMEGAAAEAVEDENGNARWQVSVKMLLGALGGQIAEINVKNSSQQDFRLSGSVTDKVILNLPGPPAVPVTLQIDPLDALSCVELQIVDSQGTVLASLAPPVHPHPYLSQLPAGIYTVKAMIEPPNPLFRSYSRSRQIMPPSRDWKVSLAA